MNDYIIRNTTKNDIADITRIYNSNHKFLTNHLGIAFVNTDFITNEISEMQTMNFLSCVICDSQTDSIIGVIDYKPDDTVYLSLLMLDYSKQKNGNGQKIYKLFEDNMLKSSKRSIRIDVVNDYAENVVSFWEHQGFIPQNEIDLLWGNKKSRAIVMKKSLTN